MAQQQTEKQRKLARKLIQNLKNDKPKTLTKLLVESGYSEITAKSSQKDIVTRPGVQNELVNIIEQLQGERQEIIKEMKLKRGKAGYSDLVRGLDVTTKNVELLSGRDTARVGGLVDEIFKRL